MGIGWLQILTWVRVGATHGPTLVALEMLLTSWYSSMPSVPHHDASVPFGVVQTSRTACSHLPRPLVPFIVLGDSSRPQLQDQQVIRGEYAEDPHLVHVSGLHVGRVSSSAPVRTVEVSRSRDSKKILS